jgi:DNA-binding beta-propeller fold protein YncE
MKKSLLLIFVSLFTTTVFLQCKKDNAEQFDEYFVVTNLASNSLSVIDASSKTMTTTVNIPSSLLYYSIYLPLLDKIYVTDAGNSAVQIVNAGSHTLEGRISVGAGTIMHMTGDKKNNKLWVVNNTAKTITEINANNNTAVYTLQLNETPHDIAVNATGSKIFVSVNKAGTWFIDAYSTDLATGSYKLVDSKGFGSNWLHFAYSAANNKLFAADQGMGMLWALNPDNLTATAPSVSVQGAHGITLSADEKWSYVSSITENKIYVYNNSTNSISSEITASFTPNVHNIAVTRNNDWLMDTHSGASSTTALIYSINNSSLTENTKMSVGTNPQGILCYARKK